jgi:hypothetical protein
MADIDTSPEAVERAARGAWMAHQQTAADTLRALARERDEALAQARYIAKALEAAANQRDEALAREAALREALTRAADDLSLYARHGITAFHGERASRAALTNTAAAAEARDAALVERGRREGIKAAHTDLLARGMHTSALMVAALLPDDDAPAKENDDAR